MEDSDPYTTVSSGDESPNQNAVVNFLSDDGPASPKKEKKQLKIELSQGSKTKIHVKFKPKKPKCDRQDEHRCPAWMDSYKPIYCQPLISSFLLIDIQKIFRTGFNLPLLNRITRSEGIDLLAELLGMYDLETNLISYWTLDVLSQVIKKCQSNSMKEDNIKMSMLWIHYILHTIHREQPTRKKMFKHLCIMFNRAVWQLPEMVVIPHPYHLKQDLDKRQSKMIPSPEPERKTETNIISNQEEPVQMFEEEEFGEEFEDIEEGMQEEESVNDSKDESSSVEEEKSDEEDDSKEEEDDDKDFVIPSTDEIKPKKDDHKKHDVLPEEAKALPKEMQKKLLQLAEEIAEIRKTNKKDFFLLVKIIYRIFANRFKYTVIWEAFARPPQPKIIGIGNNLKFPKRVKMPKRVKTPMRVRMSLAERRARSSELKRASSVKEMSPGKRVFPSLKKKKKKQQKKKKKKRPKHIRPLAEAVNQKFFDLLADHKYKEIKYNEYKRIMEAIKTKLNIKSMDYEKILEDLKVLIAKCKKRRNMFHKPVRTGRTTKVQ